MVSPVVYLVAAALLVGLIFFLTRSRGRTTAGRRCRRSRADGAAFSGLLSLCRPSPAAPAHALACLAGLTTSSEPDCACRASGQPRACAYLRVADRAASRSAATVLADGMAASLHLSPSRKDSLTQSLSSTPGSLDPEGPLPWRTCSHPSLGLSPCALLGEAAGVSRPTQAGSRAGAKKATPECFVLTYEL